MGFDITSIKPPLGAEPFHHMDADSDRCGLCLLSRAVIVEADAIFCPVMMEANKQAIDRWREVLESAIQYPHLLTGEQCST